MQHIRLGLSLDGQSGWLAKSSIGESTVGPLGMLGILETQLGLLRAPVTHSQRVVQYRACAQKVRNGERFFEGSFEADELGTSSTLLRWSDDWYEYGWGGVFTGEAPRRLRDMADVEALARVAVAPGVGRRLNDVAAMLDKRTPQISLVELQDPMAAFPPAWRHVLGKLPTKDASELVCAGSPGTLLRSVQEALLAIENGQQAQPLQWREDGSVMVYAAETRLAAAQWLARQIVDRDTSHALVAPLEGSALDAALAATDRPRVGLTGASPFRATLQLLPLAMRLLWAPIDFEALLEFLTLPAHPLHAIARRRIAERMSDTPGIGGHGWDQLLADLAADLGSDANAVRAEIAYWFEHERYEPASGAPLPVVLARAERLVEFFRRRLNDEDEARQAAWMAGFEQTSALVQSIKILVQLADERVSREILNKLIVQATGRGTVNPLLRAQAGALARVSDPAALIEPFDQVTWWQLGATPLPRTPAWTMQEVRYLQEEGIDIPVPSSTLRWQSRSHLRPILLARERLNLVLPPPGQEVHPLWLSIKGLDKNAPVQRLESVLQCTPPNPASSRVELRPLPSPRRWWQLPAGTHVTLPPSYSYTSLESFVHNPFQWVLQYPAQLRASALLTLPDAFRLLGNLAHAAVERLYRQPGSLTWSEKQVAAWFDAELDSLIDEEGAVLRMPGRRADLETFRMRFRNSLQGLHACLRQAGATLIEPEKALEADTAIGPVKGSGDLVVTFANGAQAVIDMKWTGKEKYREKLQTCSHMQLAIYGHVQHTNTGTWPAVAYYLLKEGELLTPAQGVFPGISPIDLPDGATAQVWQALVESWKWRRAQLEAGSIEVALKDLPATEQSNPPVGGLATEYLNPRYNPFLNLVGWVNP